MLIRLSLIVVMGISLSSCAELSEQLGLSHRTDLEMRSGPVGTLDNPAYLDPFKKYNFVMSAEDCRYFQMKVPHNWYWKLFLTVDNHSDLRHGSLETAIADVDPPWAALPDSSFHKTFELDQGGVQGVLGVGNPGSDRTALLRMNQSGAPLRIILESRVSATSALLGPKMPTTENPEP